MDFTLTDEQELLRDTARTLTAKECPAALVRAHIDDPSVADALWRHLREWVAIGEGDVVDVCLFMEELGAAVAPGPFFATTALALPLLRAIGHPSVADLVAGEVTATVAIAGEDGFWVANADGRRTFVVEGDAADRVAIVRGGDAGAEVLVVERPAADALRRVETLDTTRRVFDLDLAAAGLAAAAGLDGEWIPIETAALDDAIARMTVALAAELVGTTRWMLDQSVTYARERVQFDRPIGSFQAVQHKLVDMSLDHERALAAVYYAAMAVDAGDPDRHRAVHVAKAAAGRAAKHVARDAVQVHGGVGYTWEHDLHLYLRRAHASDALLGPATWHEDRLAESLF